MSLARSCYIQNSLRLIERKWIQRIKKDPRFKLVKGREYFSGSWKDAISLIHIYEIPAILI